MEFTRVRRTINEATTKREKQVMSSKHGVALEQPAVIQTSPALDLVVGRPGDSAHSEFGGITKMFHELLLDVAVTINSVIEHTRVLRRMPLPAGWARITSPYHVLQYDLSEHARWSLLFAVISLPWLKEEHMNKLFIKAMKTIFHRDLGSRLSVVGVVARTIAGIVKTNALLSADEMTEGER